MTTALSIRNLEADVKERLRVRAAENGRSMEAEVRSILTEAVRVPADDADLFQAMMERFEALGGVELELPPRNAPPRAPDFSR